jgi:methylglutaconyl-CoA hydratase
MKYLVVTEENKVATVKLNRPDVRNAFHPDMISELTDAFQKLSGQALVAIVLRGEGSSFCAGADLEWMKSMIGFSLDENIKDSQKLFKMFETILNCSVPVLGRLHGHVMGGGLGLAAVCDLGFAESSTQFCFSEVKLGLAPAVISPFVMRKMNYSAAQEMMLTGDIFLGPRAVQSGLIQYSGSLNEMDQQIDQSLKSLVRAGREAVIATKKLVSQVRSLDLKTAEPLVTRVIAERRVSTEAQSRMKEFLNKK